MKEFEVGDEVLVKAVVVNGTKDKDGDIVVSLRYMGDKTAHEYVAPSEIVQNLGKPQPAEPQKRGAIVRASGLGQNTPVRFVRTDYNPDYPWSPLGPQRGPGPFTWGHITGPEGNRNRTVVVEFAGLT